MDIDSPDNKHVYSNSFFTENAQTKNKNILVMSKLKAHSKMES